MKLLAIFLAASVGVVFVSSRGVEVGKRLIKTSEDKPGQWMTEEQIFELIRKKITFMDVTDFNYENAYPDNTNRKVIPDQLRFNETVQRVMTNLNSPRVQQFLQNFSSYHNRYYQSSTGRSSQLWLLSEIQSTLSSYNGNATVFEVDHGYLQRSIVARLVGADPVLRNEVVILGGHLDSLSFGGANALAPGADDNGSGSVVVLEVLRALVESGVQLNRTVEFHWYAAEEIGLLGSQAIAEKYRQDNVNVTGMLNLDVVGYYVNGVNEIAIYTDNANSQLVQFTRTLTDGYLSFGRRSSTCGYGCSDHASWNRNGFPAVFVAEAIDNPYMHTAQDTIEKVSFTQVAEFVKLGIGFAVEMGEPKNP